MSKKYENLKVTKREETFIEIEADLAKSALSDYRARAIKHLGEHAEIDGFRKGHIPEKILVERLGEARIMEEAAQMILPEVSYEILVDEKIRAVGRPDIAVTKVTGDELSFKVRAHTLPEFSLPDYKKIGKDIAGKKEEPITVEEKEIDAVIEDVRKQKAHVDFHKAHPDKGHDHTDEEMKAFMPEVNDAFAASLGDFKDVADLREKIKVNITEEKSNKSKDKVRAAIADKLIADTTFSVPEPLIENELNKMFARFADDLQRMGMKPEDYLKHVKKTFDDLKKEWRVDAEKKAKLQLIIDEITRAENIVPNKEDVDREVAHLMEHYKDAVPERAREYVELVLANEAVFKLLEEQGEKKK